MNYVCGDNGYTVWIDYEAERFNTQEEAAAYALGLREAAECGLREGAGAMKEEEE